MKIDLNATESEDQHVMINLSNSQESHHPTEEPLPEERYDDRRKWLTMDRMQSDTITMLSRAFPPELAPPSDRPITRGLETQPPDSRLLRFTSTQLCLTAILGLPPLLIPSLRDCPSGVAQWGPRGGVLNSYPRIAGTHYQPLSACPGASLLTYSYARTPPSIQFAQGRPDRIFGDLSVPGGGKDSLMHTYMKRARAQSASLPPYVGMVPYAWAPIGGQSQHVLKLTSSGIQTQWNTAFHIPEGGSRAKVSMLINLVFILIGKTGFREGAAAGWDLTFQEGFNKGYIEGFDAGFSLGAVSTHISDLDNQLNTDTRLDQASRGVCQKKCTRICVKEESKPFWGKNLLSTPEQDSNRVLRSSIVYCESSTLDHAVTEAANVSYFSTLNPLLYPGWGQIDESPIGVGIPPPGEAPYRRFRSVY
uniref:Essential protein Yae1 N-terminal domain-containing protein n=1 Tax=Timema shepardi TaxID=629360 RepID=A0A7R9ANY8_TIMSH|nr:unnamed protein product [Timema shepardi]